MTTGDLARAGGRRWRWAALTGGSELFHEDGFRRLWLARLFANTALNATLYALLVLAVGEGNGSSIKSALFITAYLLPTATLGTISGVLVDRLPKTLVLTGINLARCGVLLILVMSSTGLWTVYGVALLIAITSQFSGPAEAALLPQVVRPQQYIVANSTNTLGGLLSQIIGFAVLAPFFLNTIGYRPLFFTAAILFAIGAGFFLIVQQLTVNEVDLDSMVDAIRDRRGEFARAWQTLQSDIGAYMSVIIAVLASTASLVAVTLMPRFTHEVLNIPVRNSVFVLLPSTLGIVAGLRLVHLLERRFPKGLLVGAGFCLLLGSFTCLALTKSFGLMIEGLVPAGTSAGRIAATVIFTTASAFSMSVIGVSARSLVNERMPAEMQGRIFAAQSVLSNLASIPPILLAGLLSEALGVEAVLFTAVIVLAVVAAWSVAEARARVTG